MLGQDHTEMEKTMITRRSLLSGTAAAGLGMSGLGFAQTQSHAQSQAQSYPDRPIKVILPYTAGSPNDMMARMIAPVLSSRLGQSVVIDNRPGGGTTIGLKAVMTSKPDGYT
jgi:tripartite-type tricarboxylate transporter receptor subunit TctC